MLNINQFSKYLENQKFKVSSNLDYCWRIQKICKNENIPFIYETTGVETFFRDGRDSASRSRQVFSLLFVRKL